jgi:hypothetical protein
MYLSTLSAFVFPPVEHQGHGSQGIAVQGIKKKIENKKWNM